MRSKKAKKPKPEEKVSQSHIEIVNIEDDELCFTPKRSSKFNSISVDENRNLQSIKESIKASLLKSTGNFIDLSDETHSEDDEEVRVLRFQPPNTTFGKRKEPFSSPSVTEVGESSNSNSKKDPSFLCEICAEPKSRSESFGIKDCSHSYCTECMIKYVASKLQENVTFIKCPVPDCKGLLEPEYCRPILPPEVFERWGSALCEAVILGSEKFYCPFKDCSGMLIDDGKEVVRESECPNCWRMFCAQCKVPWHAGIDCAEFQKLNKDERAKEDIMLRKLAQNKEWKRCPKCRFYVEKSEGCMFMNCRCQTTFCYRCEHVLKRNHNHYCPNCKGR
ncbi:probable E3 ubiquitin-protein ligase RNF217 isoform X1 [Rosa chinensis]|uniref:probable E3 ubiquitin-protein ligase RNF217 isoform X1 n=1 Tax=Rosa chinensis TaxID=74649 RepID=UPI000D091735|nr:probable E3 ubiquitin-protein ligase RNF217 isoform X1 [Rosa chinensis]